MRIHYLQHVEFEDLAKIEDWAKEKQHTITSTHLYKNEALPSINSFDWLIVMGGPMNIYEHNKHPWLVDEKRFIKQAIDAGKIVLGICLGGQLIADVLGAKVNPNNQKEIGWYPVEYTDEWRALPQFKNFPKSAVAFHWHGDIFGLPDGAIRVAYNNITENQAFVYNENGAKVFAFQFHLETTETSMNRLIENCVDELINSPYIQSVEEMRDGATNIPIINGLMSILLDRISK